MVFCWINLIFGYQFYLYLYNPIYIYRDILGSVLLAVTVSKQLLLFLDKAFTNHHHPLLQVLG